MTIFVVQTLTNAYDCDDGEEEEEDNLNSGHINDNRLACLARLTWTRVIVGNYPKILN